jgi:hypothetical protein
MSELWYTPSEDYDTLCQSFTGAVRAVGRGELSQQSEEWNTSVDGLMAQI